MHTSEFTDGGNSLSLELRLVEDGPGDVRLAQRALRAANMAVRMDVAADGEQVMALLRHEQAYLAAPRPLLTLPLHLGTFKTPVTSVSDFWLTKARLPQVQ